MVSKARLLLPLPDSPVITISLLRGMTRFTFLRLCSRAPLMMISLMFKARTSLQELDKGGSAAYAMPSSWNSSPSEPPTWANSVCIDFLTGYLP